MGSTSTKKEKSDKTLVVESCGGKITLNISDETIRKLCVKNGFPVVKRDDIIILTTDYAHSSRIKVTIEGVAACKKEGCGYNHCYLHGGKKVALWISDDDREVRFITPEESSLKLLNV